MYRRLLVSSLLAVVASIAGTGFMQAQSIETDTIVQAMKEELDYNFKQLKSKQDSVYFMSLKMLDDDLLSISSEFGSSSINKSHDCSIVPMIRIGSMKMDNFKYNTQSYAVNGAYVPCIGGPLRVLRDEIWTETMNAFDEAVSNYESTKSAAMTDVDDEDSTGCFTPAPVEQYYEPVLPVWAQDTAMWAARLDKATSVFKACRLLETGEANIIFQTLRTYMVNTDGTAVVQNKRQIILTLDASIKATDGMYCPLHKAYFGYTVDEMPSEEDLVSQAQDLVKRLLALRDAPEADPYAGPAILSGAASGVFFHEIFGHRLETSNMKTGGMTFKNMIGERVLPSTFNVYCDPTITHYKGVPVNGHYVYDEEGVRGQRVHNVTNGILTDFLTSRMPIDGFTKSNGHGRAVDAYYPVSRQSNLLVETSKPYSESQLRAMLIKEAKKQGKAYGYYFKTVTNGYTDTEELNSFNVTPTEVYRVYVDGRPDELVRGVALIGTPLSMFSNIIAGGDKPESFIGSCGAESGWVDVSASAPTIFVSKIETQRSTTNKSVPTILSRPPYVSAEAQNASPAQKCETIFSAMRDEMQRSTDSLKMEDNPLPYFVDYRLLDGKGYQVNASQGAINKLVEIPEVLTGYANVSIGDSMRTNEFFSNDYASNTAIGQKTDYDLIRRFFWNQSDDSYKTALNTYAQKLNTLEMTPLPEKDQNIPDAPRMPACHYVAPSVVSSPLDTAKLNHIVIELSKVIASYPKIYDSDASVTVKMYDLYRVTSEGLELRIPMYNVELNVNGNIKAADGSKDHDYLNISVKNIDDLPSLDDLICQTRDLCEHMVRYNEAPAIEEYYVGPMMVEDEALANAIMSVISSYTIGSRDFTTGSDRSSLMVGKRLLDTKLTIHQYNGLSEYNGVKLVDCYDIDANGTRPASDMTIIENGVLKNLVCGRHPAVNAPHSTGNEYFPEGTIRTEIIPGTVHLTVENSIPYSKMKDELINEAKKIGLDHAYILKAPKNRFGYLVRVDCATGNEELVRTNSLFTPSKSDLMHVTAASTEEFVSNWKDDRDFNTTVTSIVPRALIVDTIETLYEKPALEKGLTLTNPAQR